MNDTYYSLLSREEFVEKDGAHLPLHTEPLASAAQFHEMSPEQQQKVVQFQQNQQDVHAGFGHIEICLPKTVYFEAMKDSQCNHYTIPRERANRFIADHILRKYDDRQIHDPNLRGRCRDGAMYFVMRQREKGIMIRSLRMR